MILIAVWMSALIKSNGTDDDGINRQFCGHKCRSACVKFLGKNDDKFVKNSVIFWHLNFVSFKRRAQNVLALCVVTFCIHFQVERYAT